MGPCVAGGLDPICSRPRFPVPCDPLQVVFHDVAVLTDKLFPVVEAMQKHFSAGSGTYYSDSIFFLSVAMHQIMPKGNLIPGQQPLRFGVRVWCPGCTVLPAPCVRGAPLKHKGEGAGQAMPFV